MTTQTKHFGTGYNRYLVELTVWKEEDEPRSDCIIYHDPHGSRDTKCQASLSCLEDTGHLEASSGSMHKVEPGMINDIAKWAQENGY